MIVGNRILSDIIYFLVVQAEKKISVFLEEESDSIYWPSSLVYLTASSL
jgi:hypothetical protein